MNSLSCLNVQTPHLCFITEVNNNQNAGGLFFPASAPWPAVLYNKSLIAPVPLRTKPTTWATYENVKFETTLAAGQQQWRWGEEAVWQRVNLKTNRCAPVIKTQRKSLYPSFISSTSDGRCRAWPARKAVDPLIHNNWLPHYCLYEVFGGSLDLQIWVWRWVLSPCFIRR